MFVRKIRLLLVEMVKLLLVKWLLSKKQLKSESLKLRKVLFLEALLGRLLMLFDLVSDVNFLSEVWGDESASFGIKAWGVALMALPFVVMWALLFRPLWLGVKGGYTFRARSSERVAAAAGALLVIVGAGGFAALLGYQFVGYCGAEYAPAFGDVWRWWIVWFLVQMWWLLILTKSPVEFPPRI